MGRGVGVIVDISHVSDNASIKPRKVATVWRGGGG